MAIALTGNAGFKLGYARYVWFSLLTASAIHFLLFVLTPPFEFEPYVPIDAGTLELIPPPNDVEIPPEPVAAPGPPVKIEPVETDDDVSESEIPPNFTGEFGGAIQTLALQAEKPSEIYISSTLPVIIQKVSPAYPELARLAGIEGRVDLCVVVGEDGRVQSASVIRADVTPAMEKSAIAAAMQYRFRPAMQGAVPVRVRVEIPITFRLH